MRRVLLLTVVLALSHSTLTPPLDMGVVIKVSEELIGDIARVISDQATEEIMELEMSGSKTKSGVKFNYWDLHFTELSMTPVVDLNRDPSGDRLVVDGTVRGDMRVSSRWRATKKIWFHNLYFDGSVTVRARGFNIDVRVILGENEEGVVGFTPDPTACTAHLGGLDIHFSESSASWLINLFVGFFESEIREKVGDQICDKINGKIRKGARKLETAVFERHDALNILGHRIGINNRPEMVTGGDRCAVVTVLGETDLEIEGREERETEPFFPPTIPYNERERTTEASTSQWTSSSSNGLDKMEKRRRRDAAVDWCSLVPGGERGMSVIVTEEVVSRLAEDFHHLRMIDFTATQASGTSEEYEVEWRGKSVGTVSIPTTDHVGLLRNFQVKFRVTSTAVPRVDINSEGIAVNSNLRARVTLVSTVIPQEIRVELHATLKLTGTLDLIFSDGLYSLVPTLSGRSNITNAKFTIAGGSAVELYESQVQAVERQLNGMLAEMLPSLIREELKGGLPLNIPDSLVINNAAVTYREDYILVTADDVTVNLV